MVTEFDLGPGDVAVVPTGHDAWVVGEVPVVLVDWHGRAITREIAYWDEFEFKSHQTVGAACGPRAYRR